MNRGIETGGKLIPEAEAFRILVSVQAEAIAAEVIEELEGEPGSALMTPDLKIRTVALRVAQRAIGLYGPDASSENGAEALRP